MKEQIELESLTGLVAFARAASLTSYTAAARVLGISPSAVSKSVQRLELQLGVRLFTRTTRSMVLTSEGRELQERVLRVLREVEEIQQAALAARTEPVGTLRIAAPLPIGISMLAPALPRFRKRYPKVTVDLRVGDRIVDLVEEGIDVAVRVGELADTRLVARRLAPHRICAFAAPVYLARRGIPRHPDELGKHDCVSFRFQSSGQQLRWPFRIGKTTVEIVPDAVILSDASDAVISVLVAGGGIGISPTHVAAPYVERGELVPVMHELAVERSSVYAVWPESRRASPVVKAFLRFLETLFPTPAPWDVIVDRAAKKLTRKIAPR